MADFARPFAEIAMLATEMQAVRDAGFTEEALHYPRSEEGLIALCAFNGINPDRAPPGWRYWPNPQMKAAWERVIDALHDHVEEKMRG